MAKKYLQLFESATLLAGPAASLNGTPWVGAEVSTQKVRYEKTGIRQAEEVTPEIGGGEKEQQ